MKNAIDELKASPVLTRQEIERIKLYILKKYPNNSSKENAAILSRTVYEILDKNLEGINGQQRQNIKKAIMQSTILKDKENILKWDVFSAYIAESEGNPQLKSSLMEWLNKNQKNPVSKENIEEYVVSFSCSTNVENLSYIGIKSPFKHKRGATCKYNVIRQILKYKIVLAFKICNCYKKTKELIEAILDKIYTTKIAISVLTLLILCLYFLNNPINSGEFLGDKNEKSESYVSNSEKYDLYFIDAMSYHPHLPNYFNYKSIDKDRLLNFLNARNSILAEEPYFSAIIRASKEFNLNPNILFAITGQEQSFVPKSHENANKIANNPYNVFHSWEEYNTNINDSSRIVARTIINLAKDKPIDIDIFDWINSKYAYDKNWGRGVKKIFEGLNDLVYDFHVKK